MKGFIYLIDFYQKHLSHRIVAILGKGFGCRFYPSCSEYTKISIEKNGILIGLYRGLLRILRCNPFFSGGVDIPK